ncbi:MAG: HDIG domain-containing protein [Coriobacteriia bacterium]|nr:HDIG domain-containing protein [Coriobacteriia bacterium]
MRPRSRRLFVLVALGAIAGATAIGAAVAFAGDRLSGGTPEEALNAALWGGLGALAAAAVGVSAIPVARRLLISRADVRLVEAASPVNPLMRRLMIEAPGTYTHSLATASLAEAAAEAIGADALLARVGAYYHDVGKLVRPCYFFENLAQGDNPHDAEKPSLSALIITGHVADGLELAQEYDLPQPVRDIIREHHGTSLIRYFYHKATATEPQVFEGDFRYHGGRPRTREAALVMLADATEAAVRALPQPSADEIAIVVRAVIDDKVDDRQLEVSGLSDDEVEQVVGIFSRMLVGMLHARCEYPRLLSTEREGHADQCREPSRV